MRDKNWGQGQRTIAFAIGVQIGRLRSTALGRPDPPHAIIPTLRRLLCRRGYCAVVTLSSAGQDMLEVALVGRRDDVAGEAIKGVAPAPTANEITVREVLAKFEADFAKVALAVENGEYALWVGSGISRQAPSLGNLIERAFDYIRERAVDPA